MFLLDQEIEIDNRSWPTASSLNIDWTRVYKGLKEEREEVFLRIIRFEINSKDYQINNYIDLDKIHFQINRPNILRY